MANEVHNGEATHAVSSTAHVIASVLNVFFVQYVHGCFK